MIRFKATEGKVCFNAQDVKIRFRITPNIVIFVVSDTYVPPDKNYYDLDGNIYTSVIIGDQEWLVENFKCTKYADGFPIPNLTDMSAWAATGEGAYCAYDNDSDNEETYGLLYNWYATQNLAYLESEGVQSTGWKVPTVADVDKLITYLGGNTVAGGVMKSGDFKALFGGYRNHETDFALLGTTFFMWATDLNFAGNSTMYYISSGDNIGKVVVNKKSGMSIRLVRDI